MSSNDDAMRKQVYEPWQEQEWLMERLVNPKADQPAYDKAKSARIVLANLSSINEYKKKAASCEHGSNSLSYRW